MCKASKAGPGRPNTQLPLASTTGNCFGYNTFCWTSQSTSRFLNWVPLVKQLRRESGGSGNPRTASLYYFQRKKAFLRDIHSRRPRSLWKSVSLKLQNGDGCEQRRRAGGYPAGTNTALFRALKSELSVRPLFHQPESRVKAHVMVAFLGYALWVTLKHLLKRRPTLVASAAGEAETAQHLAIRTNRLRAA